MRKEKKLRPMTKQVKDSIELTDWRLRMVIFFHLNHCYRIYSAVFHTRKSTKYWIFTVLHENSLQCCFQTPRIKPHLYTSLFLFWPFQNVSISLHISSYFAGKEWCSHASPEAWLPWCSDTYFLLQNSHRTKPTCKIFCGKKNKPGTIFHFWLF